MSYYLNYIVVFNWAPSSEFVSSSIPSWQILTAHAQPFRGARDLVFCLKVPLDSLLVWASSGDSGETARMRRLAWTFTARIGDKYQVRLTRSNCFCLSVEIFILGNITSFTTLNSKTKLLFTHIKYSKKLFLANFLFYFQLNTLRKCCLSHDHESIYYDKDKKDINVLGTLSW